MDKYLYFAVFSKDEDSGYTILFPDLPGCISECDSIEEGMINAKEALELYLFNLEEDEEEIPKASKPEEIELENDEFITPISVYMPVVRDEMNSKAVKKTLTIPYWLNKIAEKEKVNYSCLLQKAIKTSLGITERERKSKNKNDEKAMTKISHY